MAAPPRPLLRALPWALAAAVVLAQVAYPLLDGEPLRLVTIVTVLLFAAASTAHAAVEHGAAWAARLVAVVVGVSLSAEVLSVATGFPFGRYEYAGTLGPQLAGVPLLVPLAWLMFAYPAFVVARRLARRWVPLVGGLALASWDLYLDPQMVEAGHWVWEHPDPALPGLPGIPLTNYAGWVLVAVVVMALLDRLPRTPGADDRQPVALFLWTWAGYALGAAVFMGRPVSALYGAVAMGCVAVPLLRSLRRR
ncbi:carotenoid biosynthesis protein [Vallicoccus soli]|uniref:Carotenoid biosynthesis protein n=1 Tax=Vallicoccus soli TaxID=2339232 RepID=A0A3A3Z7M3_9ACTN|nr:carotenoid biosynthesis protein [Vallicoccus soli]